MIEPVGVESVTGVYVMAKGKQLSGKKARASHSAPEASLLDSLQPEEAALTLQRLVSAHPELRGEAEHIARSLLGAVSFESVADQVEDAIRQLDLDDLNGRAGGHSWGYVEPTEAAWELLEETVGLFIEDMKRHLGLGLEQEALAICQGIVLGLYRLRNETGDEFLGWAPDFPAEAAGNLMADWLAAGKQKNPGKPSGKKQRVFPTGFADKHVPEWREMLHRITGEVIA